MAIPLVHVCHVQTTLGAGGLENGVVNIVNGLDPERFRSTIVCLHAAGVMEARVKNPTARVINLAHPDRLAPELPNRLRRLFKSLAPDIVHTRNYTPNLYGTLGARLARVPSVVNGEHGMIQLVGWRKKLVSRALAPLADRVLCVSPGLRDYLVDVLRYPPGSVEVIVNGVDLERFRPRPETRAAVRRELGIPEDVWLVGVVGRFYPFKDHPALIELLARVPEAAGRPLHACVLGDGDGIEAFRARAEARGVAGRMHLPGFRQNVNELYAAFDVFALLSTDNEGTSNAVLEAMASGLPLVVTRIKGNEHLIRDGENGLLVPAAGEPKHRALAETVPALLRDEPRRRQLAAAALRDARERFGLARMIENYAAFYASLAARPGAPAGHDS